MKGHVITRQWPFSRRTWLLLGGALLLCFAGAVLTVRGGMAGGLGERGKQTTAANATANATANTIGLLLSGFDYQFYITPDGKEECPNGLTASGLHNWRAQFPTRAQREAHFARCGAIDNRGPNCESVVAAPQLVHDPLPYREVEGRKSNGVNLDGTADGQATPTTCAHRKFTSPDGKRAGIDNQYYRLFGCHGFAHLDLLGQEVIKRRMTDVRHLRTVLEISGVDDARNDPQVDVTVYQGLDPLVVNAENNALPYQSQRIDKAAAPQVMRGRIVDGELITEPANVAWRDVAYLLHIGDTYYAPPVLVHGTQLRLRLTGEGARGLRVGYVDTAQLWKVRESGFGFNSSAPAMYEALHRLADGYKDPRTGQCTGLSSAVQLEFVRTYIQHATPATDKGDKT